MRKISEAQMASISGGQVTNQIGDRDWEAVTSLPSFDGLTPVTGTRIEICTTVHLWILPLLTFRIGPRFPFTALVCFGPLYKHPW